MYVCPHCNREGISSFQKLLAVTFVHATCPNCGQQSYIHILYGLMALTTWIVITWLFIGLAYFFRMSFILFGTVPALMLAVDKFLLRAPLFRVRS